nr:MAG TPA: hypothetical protein [Caudoviricetes sp.]
MENVISRKGGSYYRHPWRITRIKYLVKAVYAKTVYTKKGYRKMEYRFIKSWEMHD